ncbi:MULTISPECIES: SIS domain-containing protein [Sphingomonas]|uniref:SIS domain-containing protein n=1 Tax=Sphingomonas TaxID=13687 RepID=UPI001AE4D6B3
MTASPVSGPTLMFQEAAEAGAAVARMLAANGPAFAALGAKLRAAPPAVIVTCARGSSDHAATYGKYLIETRTGIPVASAAPSVASVYAAPAVQGHALCIAISQSGRSPDLLATVAAQKAAGAHVVALVNDATSPLADTADTVIALSAGVERSVAATKSYIASLAALAALVAEWAEDDTLRRAVMGLPDALARSWALDWGSVGASLQDATNLFVIGRGIGLAVAQEAALKLKETCGLHAEAFSSAEVRHGPMAIVGSGFPIIAFATSDVIGDDVRAVAADFAARGARVSLADARVDGAGDPPALTADPAIEPILMIQSFYRMADALSRARGYNPDAPSHLSKVTRTL